MIELLILLGAIYGAAFLLVAFLPGWRTLLTAGVVLGLPLAWVIREIDADSGLGAALLFPWIMAPTLGFASGLAVRTGTLLLRRKYKSLRVMLVATLAGFFVTPGAIAGLIWWDDWKRRLPSEACLSATFQVRIADASYAIPAAPLFAVVTGPNDRDGVYRFYIPYSLRAFCGLAASSSSALHATALHIDFETMKRSYDRLVGRYCEGSPAAWITPLCQDEPPSHADYPIEMSVYSASEYDHRHMLASETYQQFLKLRNAAASAGKPLSVTRIGNFDVYSNRYWIARAGPWASRLAEPLTLSCYESNRGLYCQATHEAPRGTQITYEFRTAKDEIEATVTALENTIARILSELSAH